MAAKPHRQAAGFTARLDIVMIPGRGSGSAALIERFLGPRYGHSWLSILGGFRTPGRWNLGGARSRHSREATSGG